MPDFLLKVGSIVLLLGGLIFVHELGHFVVAKALRVKVLRFSIGFGPRLFGFRRGETEYRISLLPLGGYVKMAGDDPAETMAPEDQGRGFLEQSPWRRLAIALAGPSANLLFPAAIYFALAVAQNGEPTAGPVIGTVIPGSPAAVAGIRPGDRVLSVATPGSPTRSIRHFVDLSEVVSPRANERLVFRIERDGKEIEPIAIVPAPNEDSSGIETRGVIGVAPTHPPALVAPARPGAAGPLEPFDVVVSAGGRPVRHLGDLGKALEEARCGPLDLEVVRERAIELPGANLAAYDTVRLAAVPTCVGGEPSFLPADQNVSTFIAAVAPGSPAEQAGIRRGDAIVAVNGIRVHTSRDVNAVGGGLKPGAHVRIDLAGGRTVEFVADAENYVDEITMEKRERPFLGLFAERREFDARTLLVEEVELRRSVAEMGALAWREVSRIVRLTVLGIVGIITQKISFKTVGGPLMLIQIASQAAEAGLSTFLFYMALISVNLGLMNLLPIPVLDGGHIAQALLESVTRRPLSLRAREIANIVGLILLFTLMLFVFKNDIVRLIG